MSGAYEESEYVFCDLQNAYRYIRRGNPAAAAAFLEAAYDTFEFLAEFPGAGRPRPEFGYKNLRSWRVSGFRRYLIFYRDVTERIQIWRVLHGSQDLESILGQSD